MAVNRVTYHGLTYSQKDSSAYFKRKRYVRKGRYVEEMLHRVVWEDKVGPIPAGHVIIHLDGNKANNDVLNLDCVPMGYHLTRLAHARKRGAEA